MRLFSLCLCLLMASPLALADRLKDIGSIAGVRSNQLIGYGLVVGLDGSGEARVDLGRRRDRQQPDTPDHDAGLGEA